MPGNHEYDTFDFDTAHARLRTTCERLGILWLERETLVIHGVRLVGTARDKAGILSFLVEGIHPHDLGTILDSEGVAIRTGHHCAMPLHDALGIPASTRASFHAYTVPEVAWIE